MLVLWLHCGCSDLFGVLTITSSDNNTATTAKIATSTMKLSQSFVFLGSFASVAAHLRGSTSRANRGLRLRGIQRGEPAGEECRGGAICFQEGELCTRELESEFETEVEACKCTYVDGRLEFKTLELEIVVPAPSTSDESDGSRPSRKLSWSKDSEGDSNPMSGKLSSGLNNEEGDGIVTGCRSGAVEDAKYSKEVT